MPERKDKLKNGNQHDRFVEAARALNCNEDEAEFDAKLAVLAKQKPKADPTPSKTGE